MRSDYNVYFQSHDTQKVKVVTVKAIGVTNAVYVATSKYYKFLGYEIIKVEKCNAE